MSLIVYPHSKQLLVVPSSSPMIFMISRYTASVVYGYSPSEVEPEETRALEEQLTESSWFDLPPEVRPSTLSCMCLGKQCVPLGVGTNACLF